MVVAAIGAHSVRRVQERVKSEKSMFGFLLFSCFVSLSRSFSFFFLLSFSAFLF